METGNYAYLVYGWDEYRKAFQDDDHCKELWSEIYNEYCKITQDNTSLLYYDIHKELSYLKTRYYIVSKLLDIMVSGTVLDNEKLLNTYIEALKSWRYFINTSKPIEMEIQRMYRDLKLSENKIGLKESELEAFDSNEEERASFTSEVVGLELALNKNNIDPKKTSVEKWRAMIDNLKERNNQIRRAS